MLAPFIPRIPDDAFGREPRGYDDLRRLAARYARDALAGRTLANHATQFAITLTPEALAAATRPGAPAALLWAIAELPLLLAHALYVRTVADRQRRPEVRRLQLLGATAEVAGRPVELLFVVRENFNGQCFLDRVIERDTPDRRRQAGGEAPDDAGDGAPDDADAGTMADVGETGSTAAPSSPNSGLPNQGAAGGKLTEAYVKQAIDQAFKLGGTIYETYVGPNSSPQAEETVAGHLQKYQALQQQLSGIVTSGPDNAPSAPMGVPDYVQQAVRASLYLYSAAVNANLAGPDDIPEAVIRGIVKPPFSKPVLRSK